MNQLEKVQLQKYLLLARALFKLVSSEKETSRLNRLYDTILSAKPLFDALENELHPDLGLELLEYIKFKQTLADPEVSKQRKNDVSKIIDSQQKVVEEILELID